MDYIVTQNGELVTTDELYHWGIKGMKWGRRLYQNKDGSLTPLGKKRYAREEAALKERERTIKNREREVARRAKLAAKKADLDAREEALNGSAKGNTSKKSDAPDGVKKNVKDMSDEELNQAIQRARMEDAYRQLRPDPVAKPGLGKRLVDEVAIPALMSSGRKAVESIIDKSVKDLLKDKVDPNSLDALKKTAEKLKLQREIEKYKKGEDPNEKPLSWEERTKKYNLERQMKKDAEADVQEAAKKAEEHAKAAKQKAKEKAAYDEYNRKYTEPPEGSSGGEYSAPGRERVVTRPWQAEANRNMPAGYLEAPEVQQRRVLELPEASISRGERFLNSRNDVDDYTVIVEDDGTLEVIRRDR